jgi:parallel beta-helix repeat protein
MSGKKAALGALAIVIVLLIAVVFFSRSTPNRPPSAGPHSSVSTARGHGPLLPCHGVRLSKGQDIAAAVAQAPPGTTFCFAPATYEVTSPINVKSGDAFVGTAPRRDGVTVRTNSAQLIFNLANAVDVRFQHFGAGGAINACPGNNCGATGRAISQGGNVTVKDMHLYGNGRSAIGGTADGLLVTNSEIDHNGAALSDGVSAGIKAVHSFSVIDSFIHDNVNNGIWCDIQCGHFVAQGNVVSKNSGNGIFMEISQGPALIANNTIKNNNTSGNDTAGGISITDSRNVVIRGNTFSGNQGFGIGARMDQRTNCGIPTHLCGFVVSTTVIQDNVLHGDPIVGCDLSGVACKSNR